jgi:hypothetical protein
VHEVDALLVEVRQQRRKNVAGPAVFDASDGLAAQDIPEVIRRLRELAAAADGGLRDHE